MEYVERARAGGLVLRERRDDDAPEDEPVLELRVNGVFVMDTAETGSERALATSALDRVRRPRTVLVGGLGLGFTAQAVLADGRVERVVVAEVEQILVEWMRDGTVPHGPALLADPRLGPVVADVREVVDNTPDAAYDLVLLDVDNGPEQLVHAHNAALYREPFLAAVRRVLRPGGALAVWTADEAAELQAGLAGVFGRPGDRTRVLSHAVTLQGREERYWLHLGTAACPADGARS